MRGRRFPQNHLLSRSARRHGDLYRPLDPWDFEKRDWIPNSGWPFGLKELEPYYAKSHKLLQIGPNNFDPDHWEKAVGRNDVRRLPLVSGMVRDTISQFSPPSRFGKLYRSDLKQSEQIRVYLYANVVSIDTEETASTATCVQVKTLSGRSMQVSAKVFVLATGGIENPRLLLASNKVQAAGLGNGNDLVGRYFMDHPRLYSGKVNFTRQWSRNKLYDIKYHYQNASVSADGIKIAAQLSLVESVLKKEKLLNSRVWFSSIFPGEGSEAAQALFRCKQALLQKELPGWDPAQDMVTMMSHPIDTFLYGFTRLVQPRSLIKGVEFEIITEPEPDPSSRITLSPTKLDQLGMPRVCIDWRLGTNVQRTVDRTLEIIANDMRSSGIASVDLDPAIEGKPWPARLEKEGTWHHMGTTRMHESPKQGVVDSDCKVHGMSNLYVAGSSVFPTAGANFPTITIAALTLRLSEHIAKELKNPKAILPPKEGVLLAA